jgi:hypothetical protein
MEWMIFGAALLAIAVLMVLVARPRDGESASFLKSWPVGQAYILVTMSSGVAGITLVVANWPH